MRPAPERRSASRIRQLCRNLGRDRIQIGLLFTVLLLFWANALGAFARRLGMVDLAPGGAGLTASADTLVLLSVGALLSLLLPVASPIVASMLTLCAMLALFYAELAPGAMQGVLTLEYSLLTILILFVCHVVFSYFVETRQKHKLVEAFGKYVPPELAKAISRDPESFSLEGVSREMTVMFCDVHNFTSIAEKLGPKELAELLNTLFTPLTRILYKHKGTIDKYIGDAIMAFWGAPMNDRDHARHALNAASDIQREVRRLAPAFAAKGWPEITVGIGINTGVMNVGNMGSKYRVAYTVIGDAVNLAARIQDLTGVFEADIIVGEDTRRACPIGVYRELGLVQVRGKHTLARVYEPCNVGDKADSTLVESMLRHNDALQFYYDRQWEQAAKLFETLHHEWPQDPLYSYYLERIGEFRVAPPPPSWAGQLRFDTH